MSCHWHVFLLFMGFCNVFAKQTIPNVDTKNPIIFSAPSGNSNDYFGHGVAIGKQMAIIGGPGSDTHGQIFKCEFNGKGGRQTVVCPELPGKFCIEISKRSWRSPFSPDKVADNLTLLSLVAHALICQCAKVGILNYEYYLIFVMNFFMFTLY